MNEHLKIIEDALNEWAARESYDSKGIKYHNCCDQQYDRAHDYGCQALRGLDAVKALREQAEQEPCDMGVLCIGCSPRNVDGSCPSEKPNGACGCYVKGFNDGMKELEPPPPRQPLTDDLERALEGLVNRCNHDADSCNWGEVIAAEASLERVYKSRTIEAAHGIKEGGAE